MAKKYYLIIDGEKVPVSKELYKEYQRFTRKEKYFSVDLKTEKFIYDQEKMIAIFIPGREDSYERLLEQDKQFSSPDAVTPEDSAIKAILLEKLRRALHTLTDDELELIYEFFYLERTEREVSAAMKVAASTLRDRKNVVLQKLRKLVENFS